jgi:1,4-alpha-glucan branching enzyme
MTQPARRSGASRAKPKPARQAPAKSKPVARKKPRAGGDDSPWLSEFDLHLFGEGTHERLYEKMGAQLTIIDGVAGVHFAVWAPNAAAVSVIGSFNGWDASAHSMQRRGTSGVWERFVPGVEAGALYKFEIVTRLRGRATVKADPYGFAMELRPNTASIVVDLARYQWNDAEWMATRADRQRRDRPLAIYEVHAGSWKRRAGEEPGWLSWRELADDLVPYAKRMGFTHIELLPVTEHPYDASWGYQTVGYFAATARFGSPDDFRHFVDRAHQAGIGVILDWVPAHFPKDAHGLGFFDGTHLYEHADPRKGEHRDWGTLVFNLGRPQVSGLLLASALHWLDRFHVDGLRVDAVASMLYLDYSRKAGEWVPNVRGGRENLEAIEFLRRFNTLVHARFPGVLTFAEESTSWPRVTGPVEEGGLGFDLKWNMGWMNDMLAYMATDPLGRAHQQAKLTFSIHYAWRERFLLPLSHDEVVHGKRSLLFKMPGDAWKKFANLRALVAWMYAHPGKKLLFMGGEVGQIGEWNFERQVTWPLLDEPLHASLQAYVAEVNRLYGSQPALHQVDDHWDGFQWIDFKDTARSVISFIRHSRDPEDRIVVVANFTPVPREDYVVRVPGPGPWRELLNSDDERWGGSGVGQPGGVEARSVDGEVRDGLGDEVTLRLPPLGVVWLKVETR